MTEQTKQILTGFLTFYGILLTMGLIMTLWMRSILKEAQRKINRNDQKIRTYKMARS